MRKTTLTIVTAMLALTFIAVSAHAKPVKAPRICIKVDQDKDGWPSVIDEAVPDCKTNKAKFTLDCNDVDRKVHPGAREIVGDGIDNDCKGGDATAPAWAKKFCGSKPSAKCIARRTEEISRCSGHASCTVNYSRGKFVPGMLHVFYDKDCDGIREVMTKTDRAKLDTDARARGHVRGHKCASKRIHRRHKRGTKRTGKATPKRTTKAPKLTVDPRTGKLVNDVAALGKTVTGTAATVKTHGTTLQRHEDALELAADERARIEAESKQRDADLAARIDGNEGNITAIATANRATRRIADANRLRLSRMGQTGFLIEAFVGLHMGGQQSVTAFDGKGNDIGLARGSFLVGPEFSLNLGAWLPSARVNAFGGVTLPFEEGPSGDMDGGLAGFAGLEYLWRIGTSDNYFGLHGMFRSHDSGGDVLGSNVVAMGGSGGVTYAHMPRPKKEAGFVVGFLGRASCGGESLGTQGDGFRAVGSAWFCGASLGGSFGFSTAYEAPDNTALMPLGPTS